MMPMPGPDGRQDGGAGKRAARQARLADKLRQNLVRRKAKARALRDAAPTDVSEADAARRGAPAFGTSERKS
jgi:hypothetical protein